MRRLLTDEAFGNLAKQLEGLARSLNALIVSRRQQMVKEDRAPYGDELAYDDPLEP